MTPKCLLPAGVPTKTNYSTVVVEKLTSLSDYMTSETQARKLIGKYVDFVTDYLSQLQNVKPEDVWMVVSTDFKTDNIMIQKNTEQLFITDFSPMRKHRSGRFYYVTTPIFVFKDDFTDFNPNKVYADLQISKIAYKISLLCMLTTLMHLILGTINLKKKISSQDALWEAYDMMENFNPYTIKTLTSRQNHVVKFLQTYSEYFDLKTVRKWLKISPFGTRKTVIRRSRSSRQPQPVAAPKSKVVTKGKSMACREFLARLQGSGSRLTNPITGKQILKVGANGKQNPLVKKILQYCA
jgi:serine/threonine protein kinase